MLTLRALKSTIEDHATRIEFGHDFSIRKDLPTEFHRDKLSTVTWSVWDSRHVRQGAHLVADELSLLEAVEVAVALQSGREWCAQTLGVKP